MKAMMVLAVSALALTAGIVPAASKTYAISLDGHCDVITLTVKGTLVAGTDASSCAAGFGGGLIGKVKGFGDAIVAGVQFTAKSGNQFVFQVQWPLVTGGSWILYDTTDGVHLTQLESGTYTVQSDGVELGGSSVIEDLR